MWKSGRKSEKEYYRYINDEINDWTLHVKENTKVPSLVKTLPPIEPKEASKDIKIPQNKTIKVSENFDLLAYWDKLKDKYSLLLYLDIRTIAKLLFVCKTLYTFILDSNSIRVWLEKYESLSLPPTPLFESPNYWKNIFNSFLAKPWKTQRDYIWWMISNGHSSRRELVENIKDICTIKNPEILKRVPMYSSFMQRPNYTLCLSYCKPKNDIVL